MIEKLLTIGSKIELRNYRSKTAQVSSRERKYASQLMDVKGESKVTISMPTEGGRMVLLEVGERYEIFFYTKNGLYSCVAKVEARYRSKQLILADMVFLTALEKYQRRQYYRLNCILDTSYWLEEVPGVVKKGVIIDISGGGAKFNSAEAYEPGTMLRMKINLPSLLLKSGKEVQAKVISSETLPNKEKMYENRVEFLDVEGDVREAIVKFIFEEERKRRRRDNGG